MRTGENSVSATHVTLSSRIAVRAQCGGRAWRQRAADSLRLLMVAASVALASVAFGQAIDNGFIEVRGIGIDGAEVFLGRSSVGQVEDGQLLIGSIAPGQYALRVELPGFFPRLFDVQVEAGMVTAVQVGALSPSLAVEVDPSLLADTALVATSASIELMCFPMECALTVLEAPESLIGSPAGAERGEQDAISTMVFQRSFGDATLRVRGLPEGAYRFGVVGERGESEFATGLCHGETLGVFVDFSGRLVEAVLTESAYPNCPALPPRSADDATR